MIANVVVYVFRTRPSLASHENARDENNENHQPGVILLMTQYILRARDVLKGMYYNQYRELTD